MRLTLGHNRVFLFNFQTHFDFIAKKKKSFKIVFLARQLISYFHMNGDFKKEEKVKASLIALRVLRNRVLISSSIIQRHCSEPTPSLM